MPSAFVAGTAPQPISSLTNINQPSSSSASNGSTLGPDAFLQLLTTELQNQDPTQPQDPTQQVSQLAQMSALQYQQQLSSAFQNFQSNFSVMQAASLIGKQATVNVGASGTAGSNGGSTVTGTIASIEVQNGQPYFTMTDSSGKVYTDNNGSALLFSTSEITGIGTGA
ncbi:MAG TPA: flagellar hook capping FlgD N-terminal domain-containing protein [Candidatus Aquilonibacter sp.]|nr:flagellar hook capping FlgD N-terminal domain-containing protein [Candidatus Aquilonibacter sp.]